MPLPILLAHGALGPFDEIIFLGVGVAFVILMGISWFRSRGLEPDPADPGTLPAHEPDHPTAEPAVSDPPRADRFQLD